MGKWNKDRGMRLFVLDAEGPTRGVASSRRVSRLVSRERLLSLGAKAFALSRRRSIFRQAKSALQQAVSLEDRGFVGLDDQLTQGALRYVVTSLLVTPVADILWTTSLFEYHFLSGLTDSDDGIDREVGR